MAAAGLVVTALVAPQSADVASAAPQQRVVVMSSLTGVTYSAIHSCAATSPRYSAVVGPSTGDRVVELNFFGLEPGESDPPFAGNRLIDGGSDKIRSFEFIAKNAAVDANRTFVLRERIQGTTEVRDVFRIAPTDCPDYAASPLSTFTPIDPTRTLDTRPGLGPDFAGPRPSSGTVIDIPASALPNAPDGVVAVSLTVSLAGSDARGFVQAFPTGKVEPGGTANVNSFAPGQTVGNLAIVPVGNGGGISLFTSVGGHLIVDVNGYFVTAAEKAKSGRIETITAKRMFDSRTEGPVNSPGGALTAGQTVTIDMTSLESGLPVGATAAIVNITATRSAAAGFVQATAGGTLVPGTSAVTNVNSAGQTSGGLSIVPLAPDGTIDLHTSGGADVIMDLTGWFTGDDADESATGLFVPLDPERVFDTRPATLVNHSVSSDMTARLDSAGGVALGAIAPQASAVFVNATVINPVSNGFIQIAGSNALETSNVNYSNGSVVANAAVAPFSSTSKLIRIRQSPVSGLDITLDLTGYFTK